MVDRPMLRLVTDGDVRRYDNVVRRVCRRFYLPGADRADLLQEARIGLVEALRSYDSAQGISIESWIYTVAHRRVFDALKRSQCEKRMVLTDAVRFEYRCAGDEGSEFGELWTLPMPDQQQIIEARDLLDRILSMPLSDLEACVLAHLIAGSSYREMAADLGTSEKSIDNACQRLRRKITRFAEAA
jgi:RNA polymerase sporulation-specific sigma factor